MEKPAGPQVELRDVRVQLPGHAELQVASLAVDAGQRVALFGGAGAGKSLLLRVLAGRVQPSTGSRVVAPNLRSQGDMQFVPRAPAGPGFLTCQQVLALAYRSMSGVQRASRAAEALAAADLYPVRHRRLSSLSDGSRLALRIATAAGMHPAVLLMDDCTASLPEPAANRIWQYLEELRQEYGLTLIYATTRSDEAEEADVVVMMDHGRVLRVASAGELLAEVPTQQVMVEALDPKLVSRTIRGTFHVEVEEEKNAVTFRTADGALAAADLFRRAGDTVRMVTVERPSLWDALAELTR